MKYIVSFGLNGRSSRTYYTHYHAEQFCAALRMNGTAYTLTKI